MVMLRMDARFASIVIDVPRYGHILRALCVDDILENAFIVISGYHGTVARSMCEHVVLSRETARNMSEQQRRGTGDDNQ